MTVNEDDVTGHQLRPSDLNRLGERIRLTELHRRGELTDEEYRRRLAEVDDAA